MSQEGLTEGHIHPDSKASMNMAFRPKIVVASKVPRAMP